MNRPRDSQRNKLYAAEREVAAWGRDMLLSVPEMQAFVNRMLASTWLHSWLNDKPRTYAPITVTDGRRHRKATAYDNAIAMPRWSRCKLVIIHEVAHVLARRYYGLHKIAPHGREYARFYVHLIQHFLGATDAEELKAAFKRNNVKYSLPRKSSSAPRQMPPAAIEALKKWRESKAAERKD